MEMTEDIKVGILLSCFNGERYLKIKLTPLLLKHIPTGPYLCVMMDLVMRL